MLLVVESSPGSEMRRVWLGHGPFMWGNHKFVFGIQQVDKRYQCAVLCGFHGADGFGKDVSDLPVGKPFDDLQGNHAPLL